MTIHSSRQGTQARRFIKIGLYMIACILVNSQVQAGRRRSKNWLLTKADIEYVGAFRLPKGSKGKGKNCSFAYSSGAIAYHPERNSFYVTGHVYGRAAAEITNPGLGNSIKMKDLPRAKYVQAFRPLLKGLKNPDKLTHLGGFYIENNRLLFTGYEFYDADCSARDVFGLLTDAGNLASSKAVGLFQTGHGAHTAGWVSPIPKDFQAALKGTHIIGCGKSQSIAGRYPLRPTAFSFNGADVFKNDLKKRLQVTRLIDGDLKNEMPKATWNKSLDEAYYAIIVPGTRTYIAFGTRGGMHDRIGYKITTYDGRKTGGYSTYDDDDHYAYYWMFKVDDMIKAASGKIAPFKIYPYEHGKLALPFPKPMTPHSIVAGTWDAETETVYLTLKDREWGRYSSLSIIAGLRFKRFKGKDSTAPYGTMTKPNGNAKVKGTTKIEAHAIDNVDKESDIKVQFLIDDKNFGDVATKFPYRTNWDSTKVANGQHKVSAIATDRAGNKRNLGSVTVTVSN